MGTEASPQGESDLAIAIIGMAGRFPGADSVETFWDDLKQARDVITHFGGAPRLERGGRSYVDAGYVLRDIAGFDAGFFDMAPREAAATDPQHRLFLECAWEALEQAGYVDESRGTIGVYASANFNTYLFHVSRDAHDEDITQHLPLVIGNDKDYLPTRVSYKLNLTGSSLGVHTACSSSLVAVSLAAQALINHQCDVALAGGAGVRAKQEVGYFTDPDQGLLSHDGRCRPFDAKATGYVGGNGVGVVVLKRLADALADRDTVHAVIRGFAVNNDGAGKVGYTAPSVEGHASVVREALALADVHPGTVSYVETHGTGTPLGDPIEAEALGRHYGRAAGVRCVLGSVKSNIGHLDAAAGVAGLIKATLCLAHGYLPATRHFETPNPKARLDALGFSVLPCGQTWPRPADGPRRAAVSSLGIGGTNAHVVLEEAPTAPRPAAQEAAPELLVVSARTQTALNAACQRLAEHLARNPGLRLADVAYTLQVGRKALEHRRFVVAYDVAGAARALVAPDAGLRDALDPRAAELVRLGQAWAAGAAVDLRARWADRTDAGRVPLPTYPFERARHWIDAPPAVAPAPAPDRAEERRAVEEWLYAPSWRRTPPPETRPMQPQRWLVFAGRSPLAAALIEGLARRSNDVITVSPGSAFAELGPGRLAIDPSSRADYDRLLAHLCKSGPLPTRILHLWSLSEDRAGPVTFAEQQHLGFFGLLSLAQALEGRGVERATRVFVVSDELFAVLGEEPITADKATLLGACRVLSQELPALRYHAVDVTDAGPGLADRVLRELHAESGEALVAYRGVHRWIADYEPIRATAAAAPSQLRERGVYMVVGGLGGVGLALAEHMARTVRVRLVLTSRTGLPPREEWDQRASAHDPSDRTSRRIAAVRRLEQLGAEVLVASADVASETDMAAVVGEARRCFGALHGVLHVAGPAGRAIFRDALDTKPEHADAHFRPKVQGLRVLARVLPQGLDFVLVCSSMSTVLGGLGLAAYAAANHFMDAFVLERSRAGEPWLTINWDVWRSPADPPTSLAIDAKEGGAVLEAALALRSDVPLVVSTVDLAARRARIHKLLASGGTNTRTAPKEDPQDASRPARRIARRPALAAAYEAPRNDLERCLVDIWQESFGIEPIGIHDAFRDLGGESLAAMPLVARLSEAFRVKLRMARFFSAATIARLTEAIAEADPVPGRAAKIAAAIQTVKRMSPDDVQRALNRNTGT